MPKIILTKNQLKRLADITSNLGLVFFASIVIPYTLDKGTISIAITGFALSVLAWLSSLIIERKIK